jgi:hypothetical protein
MTEQEIETIKEVIENKLAVLDTINPQERIGHWRLCELRGMKILLWKLGCNVDFDISEEHDKKSTYSFKN